MRILHIIDSEGLYGAETLCLNLMSTQRLMGQNPELLCLGDVGIGRKAIEEKAHKLGFTIHSLRFKNGLNLKGAAKILEVAKSTKTDIIHSHGYKSNILMSIIPKKIRKIPIVSTIHGYTSKNILSKMGVYEFVDALLLRRINGVISVSKQQAKKWNLRLAHIDPKIIPNGIPPLNFEKAYFSKNYPSFANTISSADIKLICVGRLSKGKGQQLLLKALQQLSNDRINAHLALVGTGKFQNYLVHLSKELRISKQVHFMGYIKDAYKILPDFDAFVLPSFTEGLPISMLEAMQAKLPVIATNVGSIPELLEYGTLGQLIEPGDSTAITAAVKYIYYNGQQAKIQANRAKQMVIEKYSINNTTREYLKLYTNILKQ